MNRVSQYTRLSSLQPEDVLYVIRDGDFSATIETVFTDIPVPVDAASGLNLSGDVQTLNNGGEISADKTITFLETDQASTCTIENGRSFGQIKLVTMRSFGGSVTLSANIRATSIVWDTENQSVILWWDGLSWVPIAGTASITL